MPKRTHKTPELLGEIRRLFIDEGMGVKRIAKEVRLGWLTVHDIIVNDLGLESILEERDRKKGTVLYVPSPTEIKRETAKIRRKNLREKVASPSPVTPPPREPKKVTMFPERSFLGED